MRETLTVLAGLLVLTLLAALIGPHLVDWRAYRPQIEARLSAALGAPAVVEGPIAVRLLPSPRLSFGEIRVGADGTTSSARAERATVELTLAALARGEVRFSEIELDGAVLDLVADEDGRVRLPAGAQPSLPAQASIDRFILRRSAIVWHGPGREPRRIAPIAAELNAASLDGPWRIEGEADGTSLRLTTGVREADGRVRAKAFLNREGIQASFDGSLLLPAQARLVSPAIEGAFGVNPGGGLAITGQVRGHAQKLDLSGLSVDFGQGAVRLDGEGNLLPATGRSALALKARRVDLDALFAQEGGFDAAALLALLPGETDLRLDVDQMLLRGEDVSTVALQGKLGPEGLREAKASARLAGALIGVSGQAGPDGVDGQVTLSAEDARRVALALGRAGLDTDIVDLVGGLGQVSGEATGRWRDGELALTRLFVTGAGGLRLEGAGEITPARISARATVANLDLNRLPPGGSLAGLLGSRDLMLDLRLEQARYRNVPPGTASLDLRREGQNWRLAGLAIDGFGGVAVSGSGALLSEGGEISGRIRAPRFETLAALAGPLLPQALRDGIGRVSDGLARFDAGFRLTRAASGETGITLDGAAQAGKLALEGRLAADGAWQAAKLRFDLSDRRQIFAALGLPVPQAGGAGRLMLEQGASGLRASLAGAGLSVVVEGEEPSLSVQAENASQIVPEAVARLLPPDILDAHARLSREGDTLRLGDLVVNLGASTARGDLVLPRDGGASGRLALPALDLRMMLGGPLAALPASGGGLWSTARFGPPATLPLFDIRMEAPVLRLTEGHALSGASLRLRSDGDGLKFEEIAGGYAGGKAQAAFVLRREGGLAQLSGRIGLTRVDLAGPTSGGLGGHLSGQIEFGGSGETPARLVAALSGAGQAQFTDARLARFDPKAYGKVIATTSEDASESETDRLKRRLEQALAADSWALGDVAVPFTLAAGLVRLQPVVFERDGLRAEAGGTVDIRSLSADLRLALKPLGALPNGWPGDAPQIAVAWRGPLSDLRRESDVNALANTVAARALAREIERVEAFEADARERASFARRLRAEREMRENERRLADFLRAEEEKRLAEERRQEESRKAEEARRLAEEAKRLAEEKRAAELKQRAEQEVRRREAEERSRAPALPSQGGPLVLPSAPRQTPEGAPIGPAPMPIPRTAPLQ